MNRVDIAVVESPVTAEKLDVSVVVSTYNRPERLLTCVSTVIGQQYMPAEILVVHDGPGEATNRALRGAFQPLIDSGVIKFRETSSWQGRPAFARNIGIQLARGTLIAFCDDDDYWFPEKLDVQVAVFRNHPLIDAVFSYCTPISSRDYEATGGLPTRSGCSDIAHLKVMSVRLNEMLLMGGFCHSSAIVRKSAIPREFFPEARFARAFEDFGAWLKLGISESELRVVQSPLVGYLTDNATSIRRGKFSHNVRLIAYVGWQLLRAGRLSALAPFLRGRWRALWRSLRNT